MTECRPGCGLCCDPVLMGYDPADMNGPSASFVRAHWVVTDHQDARPGMPEHWLVRCDAFDRETRLCTAHEDRPPICRGYPWYGNEPDPLKAIDGGCEFNRDVRRLLPIVEVRHS